jgi:hypothetical protein
VEVVVVAAAVVVAVRPEQERRGRYKNGRL